MPKFPMDYSNTYFYKIVSKDPDDLNMYIGHTTNFTKRKHRHKGCCLNENNTHHNLPLYQHIRLNGGWENWDMILIEIEKCNNELEARAREKYYIEMFKSSLNSIKRPYVSEEEKKELYKEYSDEHREEILEQKKEYWQNNREERLEYRHEYYERERDNILERKKEKTGKHRRRENERQRTLP